jgi:hypothetical protein
MGKSKEVLLSELIAKAECLPVQVVQHPLLDIMLVLPKAEKFHIEWNMITNGPKKWYYLSMKITLSTN